MPRTLTRDLFRCPYCQTPRETPDEECCDGWAAARATQLLEDLLDTMETPRSQKASKAWQDAMEFVNSRQP